MKTVCVIASPRKKGNCKQITDMIIDKINQDHENTTEIHFIDDMNIKPCQACMGCRNPENPQPCIIDDDFRKIMDQFTNEDADLLIFAAPNYFGEINAQGHIFMDRFYSMTQKTSNYLKNHPKCIIVFTYGASDGYYDEYINSRSRLFESIGFDVCGVISAGRGKPTSSIDENLILKIEDVVNKI